MSGTSNDTAIWHLDAGGWEPSTASKAEVPNAGERNLQPHGCYGTFQPVEVIVPHNLFQEFLSLKNDLQLSSGPAGAVDNNSQVKTIKGVCLNGGKSGEIAFQTQENRKIRPSVGCGENSVPSTVVRGYDLCQPGGHLGNVGLEALLSFPLPRAIY